MDIAYGPAFFFATAGTLLVTNEYLPLPVIMVACIGVWAARLAIRIGRKNWGKPEDPRYAAWRTKWEARGRLYFLLRSYLQVNLLQGIIILVVASSFVIAISAPITAVSWWAVGLGLFVYLAGLAYESIADYQLDQFLARKRAGTEPATLMTTGLFRYSRRPNYFGETLIWWGLALMVLPLPYGWVAIFSPLLITFIVTRVTGPMLEDIFLEKYPEEYRAYMARTSYFIPLPPRRV
jgi:steroid 5-alpha reductase family enzyme